MIARFVRPTLARPAVRFASSAGAKSSADAIPEQLYKNVWRKSNIMYITYIVAGCVVIEAVYGTLTNTLWESKNSGVSQECPLSFVRNAHASCCGVTSPSNLSQRLDPHPNLAETVQANRLVQVQVRRRRGGGVSCLEVFSPKLILVCEHSFSLTTK